CAVSYNFWSGSYKSLDVW
nr:immunoglobulin heavy chain junction region [Macaca mulatta]MOW76247.1 immunoglobulin heavy chain junction region [Macaca mulatta]MOW76284.1 immunoglobulin heavy chain junction region [Macaca mulatta]MOW76349.1 immunoglobulin heavy chain junction region [Macaca mulatta]MOW76617.1 immunoglobulin heavy chain junction region [Macaca mulatta]